MDITRNRPKARLLDLSRSLARAGRVATGVDRVERAYLEHFLTEPDRFYGLIRTRLGYLLLDAVGGGQLLAALDKGVPPQKALRLVREAAVDRCPRPLLGRLLRRSFREGLSYFNVGHSNLTTRVLISVKSVSGGRAIVLLHDMIPLDFPAYQKAGRPDEFRKRMKRVAAHADQVICISEATRERVQLHFAGFGRVPPLVTAPIGVEVARPAPTELPPSLAVERPYFVALGTIEPRKNIGFLLDLWQEMAGDAPDLVICGARGWGCAEIFEKLDGGLPRITELPGLSDGAIAALLDGASALLFPSLAEGFGLPPAEAAALGVPVISNDLPSVREVIGDRAVYLSPDDPYSWIQRIEAFRSLPRKIVAEPFQPPSWEAHFKIVETVT